MKHSDCCSGTGCARQRVGPTGRKPWMLLVDSCYRCGYMTPVEPLTPPQARWVERYNRRILHNNALCM